MIMLNKIIKCAIRYITDVNYRFLINARFGFYNSMTDAEYLKKMYKARLGKPLNLSSPQTFNEKLQWLKLYNRKPEYTMMADKYKVRDYIAEKLGEEYLIPLLGVCNDPNEIDFDNLPDQFVLKCNHNSGLGMCICKDKSKLNIVKVKENLKKAIKQNYYLPGREWSYKNIKPCIVIEKYMTDSFDSDELTDYKFFCFNGKVDCVMVCYGRASGDTKYYFFDRDWTLKRLNKRGQRAPAGFTLPKPECIDKMFDIASILSVGMPFVRVDLYQSCGKVYFGEMTFYPDCGFDSNLLPEADQYFGNLIDLNL